MKDTVKIQKLKGSASTTPTNGQERDSMLTWDSTTRVLVGVSAGKAHSLGYSYFCGEHSRLAPNMQRFPVYAQVYAPQNPIGSQTKHRQQKEGRRGRQA
jgi:hypothetical protein